MSSLKLYKFCLKIVPLQIQMREKIFWSSPEWKGCDVRTTWINFRSQMSGKGDYINLSVYRGYCFKEVW